MVPFPKPDCISQCVLNTEVSSKERGSVITGQGIEWQQLLSFVLSKTFNLDDVMYRDIFLQFAGSRFHPYIRTSHLWEMCYVFVCLSSVMSQVALFWLLIVLGFWCFQWIFLILGLCFWWWNELFYILLLHTSVVSCTKLPVTTTVLSSGKLWTSSSGKTLAKSALLLDNDRNPFQSWGSGTSLVSICLHMTCNLFLIFILVSDFVDSTL